MTAKITPASGQRILDLNAQGVFQAAIGREVGVTQSAVSAFLRKKGITKSRPSVPEGQRWCRKCRLVKAISEFWKCSANSEGLCTSCKACMSAEHKSGRASMRHWARRHYGMTLEQYDEMKASTPRCPICGLDTELHLDHNAQTGKVREFLCGRCNRGIGMFDHDIDRLIAAAEYLRRHA